MPLQALQILEQKIERQFRLFELRRGVFERKIEKKIDEKKKKFERHIENHKRKFEQHFEAHKRKLESQIRRFEARKKIRIDDEVRFLRTWIEKPLVDGAVTPSGKVLARTMAAYVDPERSGPIVELGPAPARYRGAGRAGHRSGAARPGRVRSRLSAASCARATRPRPWCRATPTACAISEHADHAAGRRRGVRPAAVHQAAEDAAASAVEAFALMAPGAPFVQFTYAVVSPIPRAVARVARKLPSASGRTCRPRACGSIADTDDCFALRLAMTVQCERNRLQSPPMPFRKSSSFPARCAPARTTCGWRRSPPRS